MMYRFLFLTSIWLILPSISNAIDVKEVLNNIPVTIHTSSTQLKTSVYLYTLREHKDDKVHKIVIDAGHGGHDPGCHGAHSKEKDIALSIALQLGKKLKKSYPSIKIIYTRTKDVFIPLHKRIALANKEKADVFLSIHCNYVGNPHICGTETYVMGLHRAEENLKVAKRENAVVLLEDDFEQNYEGYDPNSPIGHILLSMFQNLHLERSIHLASSIEDRFVKRHNYKSRGVKQAGFVVLRQATMPSILVETGFLSNPKEEKYLISKKGQDEMAVALTESVAAFFRLVNQLPEAVVNVTPPTEKTDSPKPRFTIQIGVYSSDKKESIIKKATKVGKLQIAKVGDVYKYTIGAYDNKSAAKISLKKIRSQGLTDAFIKTL